MESRVFISHSSEDETIVSLFVDHILCSGSGLKPNDIIYTSRDDSGITNGEDIPLAIKTGIKNSCLFFMMVSDAYRKSEVCLNEMGAAWMRDDLPKKIILLPGTGFDRIGWLMSLSKGTRIVDEEGLDAIHDQVMAILSTRVQTATWNRAKSRFLGELRKEMDHLLPVTSRPQVEDETMDILDCKDQFEEHMKEHKRILEVLTQATIQYKDRLNETTKKWKSIQNTGRAMTTTQVRGLMGIVAKETNALSEVYEQNTSLRKEHFAKALDYAISLQRSTVMTDPVKNENTVSMRGMIDSMVDTKKSLELMKASLDSVPNLDKTFQQAKKRLKLAIDDMVETITSSIRTANEFLLI